MGCAVALAFKPWLAHAQDYRTCFSTLEGANLSSSSQLMMKWPTKQLGGEDNGNLDEFVDKGDAKDTSDPLVLLMGVLVESKRHLIAAAVARGTSMSLMFPLDTIKVGPTGPKDYPTTTLRPQH